MKPGPQRSILPGGIVLYEYQSLPSTNGFVRQLMEEGRELSGKTAFWAHEQTKGRGRGKNTWQSEKDKNICLSYFISTPGIRAEKQFDLARSTALALIHLLRDHGLPAYIKWPNDIYANDNKIAGLLIENSVSGTALKNSVIGIGLNVNQTGFELPFATSMRLQTGKEYNRKTIVQQLIALLQIYLETAKLQPEELHRAFDKQLCRAGQMITFTEDGKNKSGHVEGTDSYGRIMIRRPDGKPRVYGMDEIKLNVGSRP
jgi:BirA family biotin operon repressor/biotin-[acetyl-CoA-carboxylase] ligase